MPPHRPLLAFPIGMEPPPGSGSVQFGTDGQALEKCRPFVGGRNPGTKTLATAIPSNPDTAASSVHRGEPAVKRVEVNCWPARTSSGLAAHGSADGRRLRCARDS